MPDGQDLSVRSDTGEGRVPVIGGGDDASHQRAVAVAVPQCALPLQVVAAVPEPAGQPGVRGHTGVDNRDDLACAGGELAQLRVAQPRLPPWWGFDGRLRQVAIRNAAAMRTHLRAADLPPTRSGPVERDPGCGDRRAWQPRRIHRRWLHSGYPGRLHEG